MNVTTSLFLPSTPRSQLRLFVRVSAIAGLSSTPAFLLGYCQYSIVVIHGLSKVSQFASKSQHPRRSSLGPEPRASTASLMPSAAPHLLRYTDRLAFLPSLQKRSLCGCECICTTPSLPSRLSSSLSLSNEPRITATELVQLPVTSPPALSISSPLSPFTLFFHPYLTY